MNDILNKWLPTGLLDGLSETHQSLLAIKLENLTIGFLSNGMENDSIFATIFTILRKIFVIDIYVDPQFLIKHYQEYWATEGSLRLLQLREVNYYEIGAEAELAQEYCEKYISLFKKEIMIPKKYLLKHRL